MTSSPHSAAVSGLEAASSFVRPPLLVELTSFTPSFFSDDLGLTPPPSSFAALLFQSILLIIAMLVLLYILLKYRKASSSSNKTSRPLNFWQWQAYGTYIEFLAAFLVVLCSSYIVLGGYSWYVDTLGFIGQSVCFLSPDAFRSSLFALAFYSPRP